MRASVEVGAKRRWSRGPPLGQRDQPGVFVRGQVGEDEPVHSGLFEHAEKALRPHRQHRVEVGHEEEGLIGESPDFLHKRRHIGHTNPLLQGLLGGPLNHRAVAQGVGVGQAHLEQVRVGQNLFDQLEVGPPARVPGHHVRDKGRPALGSGLGKGLAGGHAAPPSIIRITSTTSLSPRPERLITITCSGSISGASLAA